MVSVIAPLYHPVYEWVDKIFQLIPKLFEAFNMNDYFIGFEIGEPHHLPIDFVELHLCQSTIPAKQRRGCWSPKCNNCPKCNKVLNVITFGPKCNKILNVITFSPKCNKPPM